MNNKQASHPYQHDEPNNRTITLGKEKSIMGHRPAKPRNVMDYATRDMWDVTRKLDTYQPRDVDGRTVGYVSPRIKPKTLRAYRWSRGLKL